MKKVLLTLLILLLPLFTIMAASDNTENLANYYEEAMNTTQSVERAKVIDVIYDNTKEVRENVPIESDFRVQHLELEITSGSHKGETYKIQNQIQMAMPFKIICQKNDRILVQTDISSKDEITNLIIYDRDRSSILYFCLISFIALILLIGRWKGLKSLVSLLITVSLIFFVFIPLITRGYSPLLTAFFICVFATFTTLFLVAGVNKKSLSAILGTLSGTICAMIFAIIAGRLAQLTGLGNEEAQMLAYIPQHSDINYQSLLFAGIAIGALGAVMDTALSISSAMSEIVSTNENISIKQLRKSGMNIGRDIIGSMSNTLILAYTSTNIPLILLLVLFNTQLKDVMNLDVIASEILRASAGSIGLILTIPLTVFIRTLFEKSNRSAKQK